MSKIPNPAASGGHDVVRSALDACSTALRYATSISCVAPVPGLSAGLGALQTLVTQLQTMKDNNERRDVFVRHIAQLVQLISNSIQEIERDSKLQFSPSLSKAMDELTQDVNAMIADVEKMKRQGAAKRFCKSSQNAAKLTELTGRINHAMSRFSVRGSITVEAHVLAIAERQITQLEKENEWRQQEAVRRKQKEEEKHRKHEEEILQKLPQEEVGYRSALNIVTHGVHPATRIEVLQKVSGWADSIDAIEKMYILTGAFGTGKSAIAYTVAETLENQNKLGGSYFFCRDNVGSLNIQNFVGPIARQLANSIPAVRHHIVEAIEERKSAGPFTLAEDFRHLIIEPLSKVSGYQTPVIIVVDALDECPEREGVKELFQLISASLPKLNFPLKFFLTGRPESHRDFTELSSCILHELKKEVVDMDIRTVLVDGLEKVAIENKCAGMEHPPTTINNLVNKAQGLFIFIDTLIRHLLEDDPIPWETKLQEILELPSEDGSQIDLLDGLYHKVLSAVLDCSKSQKIQDRNRNIILQVLGFVIMLYEPLSPTSLAHLISYDTPKTMQTAKNVRLVLHRLSSVILVPKENHDLIRTLHASFVNYITDPTRCSDSKLFVDPALYHIRIASSCLDFLHDNLKRNILNLPDPCILNSEIPNLPDLIHQLIPPHLQYACTHGLSHLANITNPSPELLKKVSKFAEEHVIHFLEVMSLLKRVGIAVRVLGTVLKWYQNLVTEGDSRVTSLLSDSCRFVGRFSEVISASAGHIYLSALTLSPECTLRTTYLTPPWGSVKVVRGREESWDACWNNVVKGAPCTALTYSPDSIKIAAGSDDQTVRIWDAATGKQLHVLRGHSGWVRAVAFSADGQQVASGASDSAIRIWDTEKGQCLNVLRGHTGWVHTVAFSPNGEFIVSGSQDHTVRIWNATTGEQLKVLQGHTDYLRAVTFSPDGARVASGASDMTVRIWDVPTGEQLTVLQCQSDFIRAICFSNDGTKVALASDDKTVQVWNVSTQEQLHVLRGHSDAVRGVCFSPNGDKIVSGADDKTVRVWDVATGEQLKLISGHTGWIHAVAYSPDGATITSSSEDQTIKTWDALTGQHLKTLESDSELLSTYATKDIPKPSDPPSQAPEVAVKPQPNALQGHSDFVRAVSFSPDGSKVATGSFDSTVRIWDAVTGDQLSILRGHTNFVRAVRFSPDGTKVGSGSDDKTARIWDIATGEYLELKDHENDVRAVAFSPNGWKFATGSDDKTIRIWNVVEGKLLVTLSGHTGWVQAVSFSPDGARLASGSSDLTLRIWDLKTEECLNVLQGHSGWILAVSFSPKGDVVASGSSDKTVRLWDAATGKGLKVLQGHTHWLSTLSFSAEGSTLTSEDTGGHTIRWNVEHGIEVTEDNRKLIQPSPHVSLNNSLLFCSLKSDGPDGTFAIRSHSSQLLFLLPPSVHRVSHSISLDHSTLAVGSRSGQLYIFCI
ncbi:WD40 repeat-like protein [Atractiella rhizophila]|nr:WD40 repeat-like protein [Atractiella rhizophila]